jgi:opacity protein-like surface antigen
VHKINEVSRQFSERADRRSPDRKRPIGRCARTSPAAGATHATLGDYGFSNSHGGVPCPNASFFTCDAEQNSLASLAGRVGFTWDRALLYAKAGWAAGEAKVETKSNVGAAIPPSNTPVNSSTNWQNGWTAGAGMEFAVTQHWSAKAEYMHYDLGKDRYVVDNNLLVDANVRGDTVKVGINLHFNPVQREIPLK